MMMSSIITSACGMRRRWRQASGWPGEGVGGCGGGPNMGRGRCRGNCDDLAPLRPSRRPLSGDQTAVITRSVRCPPSAASLRMRLAAPLLALALRRDARGRAGALLPPARRVGTPHGGAGRAADGGRGLGGRDCAPERVDGAARPAGDAARLVRQGAARPGHRAVQAARRTRGAHRQARLHRGRVGRSRPGGPHAQRHQELSLDDGRAGVRPQDDPRRA